MTNTLEVGPQIRVVEPLGNGDPFPHLKLNILCDLPPEAQVRADLWQAGIHLLNIVGEESVSRISRGTAIESLDPNGNSDDMASYRTELTKARDGMLRISAISRLVSLKNSLTGAGGLEEFRNHTSAQAVVHKDFAAPEDVYAPSLTSDSDLIYSDAGYLALQDRIGAKIEDLVNSKFENGVDNLPPNARVGIIKIASPDDIPSLPFLRHVLKGFVHDVGTSTTTITGNIALQNRNLTRKGVVNSSIDVTFKRMYESLLSLYWNVGSEFAHDYPKMDMSLGAIQELMIDQILDVLSKKSGIKVIQALEDKKALYGYCAEGSPGWIARFAKNIAQNTEKAYEVRDAKQPSRTQRGEPKPLKVAVRIIKDEDAPRVCFEISDEAVGFPEELLKNGFLPDYTNWGEGTGVKGTGVGMDHVIGVLKEQYGAQVELFNKTRKEEGGYIIEPDEKTIGACLRITFPVKPITG